MTVDALFRVWQLILLFSHLSFIKTPEEPKEKPWETFEATAYIAMCDTGCTGTTFTDIDVRENIYYEGRRVIAVDPRIVPLKTVVEIRLSGGYTFEAYTGDTGGDIKGNRIDVLMPNEDRAWEFGRQDVQMRVIE